MNKVILQIPLDAKLRSQATVVASDLGFSSLQETIRVFLRKLASHELTLSFEEPPVQLSPRAARRYNKMIKDVESGRLKTKSFTSVDALMKELDS